MSEQHHVPLIRPERPRMKTWFRNVMVRLFPFTWYIFRYNTSSTKLASGETHQKQWKEFLGQTESASRCLQIAVKDEFGGKFGTYWISVDKYDHGPAIDRHDDVQSLDFPDEHFDAIVCWSVLEHVPDPIRAIAEMRRVLRPGGIIWIQLPFLLPYHADPHDYWRVTPSGLRQWMRDFDEVGCGGHYWARTKIVCSTFYYGRKPEVRELNCVQSEMLIFE